MKDSDLIREVINRLSPGQAASLRDQARMELQRIRDASSQPRQQPVRLVINRQKKHG